MKKIFSILTFLVLTFFVKAQTFPITQNIASPSTLLNDKGGLTVGNVFIPKAFSDTTAANLDSYAKNYSGGIIRTTTDGKIWKRNEAKTKWEEFVVTSGGGGSSINGCYYLFPNGGIVSWSGTGLIFDVSPASYIINCRNYSSPFSQVTLAASDPSNPRFDVIYVDTNGLVGSITGTPAASPSVPQVNLASQIALTSIFVAAGATTPGGVAINTVYNQNLGTPTEWAGTSANWTSVDFGSITNPCISTITAAVSNTGSITSTANITFTSASNLLFSQQSIFKFYIYQNAGLSSGEGLSFTLYNGATQVSSTVNVLNNTFGYKNSVSGSCQTIIVPFGLFIPQGDTLFNKLVIAPINGIKNFNIDWIQFQTGITQEIQGGNYIINQIGNWQPASYQINGSGKIAGYLSVPDTNYALSEKFGLFAVAAGAQATSLGSYAGYGSGEGSINIGSYSSGAGISIGTYSQSGHRSNVAIGGGITGGATGVVTLGKDNTVNVNHATGLGQGVDITAAGGTGVGYEVTVSHANSVVLGHSGASTGANQFLISANLNRFTFGNISRGVAGYVLTDSVGDGSYWVARPATSTNIYNSDGTLTGTRTLTGGSNPLTFTGLTTFNVSTSAGTVIDGRLSMDEGANVTAASTITLGYGGNTFIVTGNTTIECITTTDWPDGSVVNLIFTGTPTLVNETVALCGGSPMKLAGRVDFIITGETTISLVRKDGFFYEISRQMAGSTGIYTASNGLTMASNNTKLGGTLIEYTSIEMDDNAIEFINNGAFEKFFIDPLAGNYRFGDMGGEDNQTHIDISDPNYRITLYSKNISGATTGSAVVLTLPNLTTGTGIYSQPTNITSGSVMDLRIASGGAAGNSQKVLNINTGGTNGTASQTTFGIDVTNSHAGTTPSNIGVRITTSNGGSGNKGLDVVEGGGGTGVNIVSTGANSIGLNAETSGDNGVVVNLTESGSTAFGSILLGVSTNGFGVDITSAKYSGSFATRPAGTNDEVEVFAIRRQTTGTAATGIAGLLNFYTETDGGTDQISNQIVSKWTTAANATRTSQYVIRGTNSASVGDIISFEGNKRTMLYGRLEMQQGADVASVAGAIAVGLDGNVFELTGTNAITLISNLNFVNGSVIYLLFTSTATLTDGTANSGTDIGMELLGNANFVGSADDVVCLVLSEIGGTQRWRMVSSSVN